MRDHWHVKIVWKSFAKEQKAAFGLFVFIGIFALVFGMKSFGAHIRRPFELQILNAKTERTYLLEGERESEEEQKQKETDTDEDGLMDYEELYVYKTSPYLSDSDSDNYNDKMEIDSGNDPNCPVGKDCGKVTVTSVESESEQANALLSGAEVGASSFEGNSSDDFVLDSSKDVESFLSTLGADDIRALLLEQGIPQETLDTLDDETLVETFLGAIEESAQNGEYDALLEDTTTAE